MSLLDGAGGFKSLALSLFVIFVASRVFKFAKDLKVPWDSESATRLVLLMTGWLPGSELCARSAYPISSSTCLWSAHTYCMVEPGHGVFVEMALSLYVLDLYLPFNPV